MKVHVGGLLKAVFEVRRIRKVALARIMDVNPVQINHYLKNVTIELVLVIIQYIREIT